MAKLDVSADKVAPQGDADKVSGGTVMSGLRPTVLTSMVLDGVVPSVSTGSVTVLDPGSVESMLLTDEVATDAVGAGLQNPDTLSIPNVDKTGSGAMEGDVDANPGVAVVLLEARAVVVGVVVTMGVRVVVVEMVIPVVGHTVIAPRDVPGIGPKVPGLSSTAPNGHPVAPIVGMVPGTAVDEVVGLAGAPRAVADPTCATADPPPTKTTADIVSKRFINVSLIAVETLVYF
jgi:hypothetical protein